MASKCKYVLKCTRVRVLPRVQVDLARLVVTDSYAINAHLRSTSRFSVRSLSVSGRR